MRDKILLLLQICMYDFSIFLLVMTNVHIGDDDIINPRGRSFSHNSIVLDRPIITQKSFDKVFIPTAYEDRTPVIVGKQIRGYIRKKCVPSKQCGKSYLKIIFPFLSWLKAYKLVWLPNDIICGITVYI